MKHSLINSTNGVHSPFADIYSTATARTTATGFLSQGVTIPFTSGDMQKIVLQTDTSPPTIWILTSVTPVTWVQFGSAGALPTDLNISGQTTGDLLYFNGTNWVRRGIGSTSQVLTVTGGVPVWATPSAGGSTDIRFTMAGDLYAPGISVDIMQGEVINGFTATTLTVTVSTPSVGDNITGYVNYSTDGHTWSPNMFFYIAAGAYTATMSISQVFASPSYWGLRLDTVGTSTPGANLMVGIK